jgi:hypothetical protein
VGVGSGGHGGRARGVAAWRPKEEERGREKKGEKKKEKREKEKEKKKKENRKKGK